MYGKDYRYAMSRLEGTIVTLSKGNIPVIVNAIDGAGRCSITKIDDGLKTVADLADLDLKPVKLGFVNYRGKAVFVARIPKRGDYRQGLRRENSTSFNGLGYPPTSAMSNAIQNQYPSFDTAFKTSSKGDAYSCAWHRHWGIAGGSRLIYKGYGVVGSIHKDKSFTLNGNFSHLKEYLSEVLRG
jgi:hypothetical protein